MINLPGLTTSSSLSQDFAATPEPIEQLQISAGECGDMELVATCGRALAGDRDAIATCERIIAEARAEAAAD
jgi:hypothetical protein